MKGGADHEEENSKKNFDRFRDRCDPLDPVCTNTARRDERRRDSKISGINVSDRGLEQVL